MALSDLIIGSAWAQAAAPAAAPSLGFTDFLPLIALVAIFYFLILRPQQARAKELKNIHNNLQKGDEVLAAGGMLGRVAKISENYVGIEVSDGVVISIQKNSIQTVLPKGTIKSI
ncbi:MAG: preprotein translocase subunit YajC [Gallionellaceae bacterium]|nr:preprotein translocase subunit YajC [Gallionellaceae bacterium]